ncbi:MAG: hypothetical protein EOO65_02770 [Methanosarcinales archaeon]|nr:MAG: hypothetical protein EOO65_02770 [Methanosarcinales archaeon]
MRCALALLLAGIVGGALGQTGTVLSPDVAYRSFVAQSGRIPYSYTPPATITSFTVTLTPDYSDIDLYISCSNSVFSSGSGSWVSAYGGAAVDAVTFSRDFTCATYYIVVRF